MKQATLISGMTAAAAITFVTAATAVGQTESPQNVTEQTAIETDSIIGSMYDELDELVVTGVRPVVTTDGATTTYNVDDDPGASGVTLLDLLRKVPMVSVDAEDNIRLKGEGNYKILVNGKEDPTLSANASQIFKMMPANAVSKVEVITEPGAKYDAEGTGGIINLITIRNQSQDGYTLGAQAYFNNRMAGGSVNGRVKHRNVTIGANVDYANGMYSPMKQWNDEKTLYLDPATGEGTQFMIRDNSQKTAFNYIGGGLKFSWEPTANDLLSLDASFNRVSGQLKDVSEKIYLTEAIKNPDGEWVPGNTLWSTNSDLWAGMTNLSSSALFSYQHNFPGNRHFLTLSYQFSFGHNSLDSDTRVLESTNTPIIHFTRNSTLNISREHTAQIDYTNDFNSEHHLLETGAKAIFRHNSAEGVMSTGENETSLVEDPYNRSDLTQIQDIAALYASYTGIFGNVNTKAGLRYEHTRMGNRYHIGEMSDFTRELNDLVPNAAVSYSFGPAQNLRLAYQMRISRPTIEQVNPYMLSVSNYMNQQGNPDLKSEHSNNVSLTYSQFGGVVGGNVGLEYTQVDNSITSYLVADGETLIRTYANLGKKRSAALNGFLNWTIIPRMSLGLNARVEYIDMRSKSPDYKNHGWQGNFGANWSYMLLSGWNFSAYGGTGTRMLNLQGYTSSWHYYGLAVNKQLLKDRSLTVGINANNFLEGSQKYVMHFNTHDTRSHSVNRTRSWNVGINVSWTFGNLKQDVKQASATIVNDDQSTTSGGSLISK